MKFIALVLSLAMSAPALAEAEKETIARAGFLTGGVNYNEFTPWSLKPASGSMNIYGGGVAFNDTSALQLKSLDGTMDRYGGGVKDGYNLSAEEQRRCWDAWYRRFDDAFDAAFEQFFYSHWYNSAPGHVQIWAFVTDTGYIKVYAVKGRTFPLTVHAAKQAFRSLEHSEVAKFPEWSRKTYQLVGRDLNPKEPGQRYETGMYEDVR